MSPAELSRALATGAAIWLVVLSFVVRSPGGTLVAGAALLYVVWGGLSDGER